MVRSRPDRADSARAGGQLRLQRGWRRQRETLRLHEGQQQDGPNEHCRPQHKHLQQVGEAGAAAAAPHGRAPPPPSWPPARGGGASALGGWLLRQQGPWPSAAGVPLVPCVRLPVAEGLLVAVLGLVQATCCCWRLVVMRPGARVVVVVVLLLACARNRVRRAGSGLPPGVVGAAGTLVRLGGRQRD